MTRLVRSAVLTNYVPVATRAGLEPYRMVREFGLPVASLADPEIRVSVVAVNRLLEESAQRSGQADFGLRLAEHRSLSNLGAMALLVREQPTVRKALEALVGYVHLHSEALVLRLAERGGVTTLSLTVDAGRPIPTRQGVELGVGFLHRSLSQLLGTIWKPLEIAFTHDAPASTMAHRRFFGVPVSFGQGSNAIQCLAEMIDVAIPSTDATLARHAQTYLDTLAARPVETTRAIVRDSIHAMLPSGTCSANGVAARLGCDRRTLHRRLARENETFETMVRAARKELVARYLANPERAIAEASDLLGFSSQSAFCRWFRREYGCAPSKFRKLAR